MIRVVQGLFDMMVPVVVKPRVWLRHTWPRLEARCGT